MAYIDAFVLPLKTSKLGEYSRLARKACKVWMDHGALEYIESVGDDLVHPQVGSFPKSMRAKVDELVVFAWIRYRNKAHRNRVNKKAMADPRLAKMMLDQKKCPFDPKRMCMGGFRVFVQGALSK